MHLAMIVLMAFHPVSASEEFISTEPSWYEICQEVEMVLHEAVGEGIITSRVANEVSSNCYAREVQ